MNVITLVTGNNGKLVEWQRLFPAEFTLESADIDLEEIQSLDMDIIIADKVRRAYDIIQKPVIVEDISAGLDNLNDLPGPFIKFFEVRLGMDALFKLAEKEGDPATVRCSVAYYDGSTMYRAHSEVKGTVVSPRGERGFGFDKVFVPAGQTKTYGEMTPAEKDSLSHRHLAIESLVAKLKHLSA